MRRHVDGVVGSKVCALAALCALATGCLGHWQGPLPGQPEEASYASVAGAHVRYVDEGQGKGAPVVMIHGFASSLNAWDGVLPEVAKNHRVIALDLKGFGWTDRPRGDYSPEAQADLVAALLDERGVREPVALVAHSWGSSVALAFAMRHPERVRRIAIYDGWVYAEQLPTFFLWARASSLGELLFWLFYKEQPAVKLSAAFYDPLIVDQPFAEYVEATLDRPGTSAAALAAVRGQRYELVQDDYATIDKPTLLMWGREDAVTPLWVGERLVKQLPEADLKVYPRCGHFPMIEARAASTRDLVAFLARDLEEAVVPEVPATRPSPPDAVPSGALPIEDAPSPPIEGAVPQPTTTPTEGETEVGP